MIFVTVGTHEQSFNRLIEYVDNLKRDGVVRDEVIMQIGYSTYEPKHCKWYKFLSYDEMKKYIDDARIVITHGGPASFIMPIQIGKVPVVVPRQKKYDEHINDHQVEFVSSISERMKNIIDIYDIEELKNVLLKYDCILRNMNISINSNNKSFNDKFKVIVDNMFK